jgi:hypothetical protein
MSYATDNLEIQRGCEILNALAKSQ